MNETLFLADIHLDPRRPATTELFVRFCEQRARGAAAVYLLGDLVDAWIGDDVPLPDDTRRALEAIAALAADGVPVHFLHGNRDFLIGTAFLERWGMQPLAAPHRLDLDGHPTLLVHGDELCTDDREYQAFRAMVRDPEWQAGFLARPLEERLAMAREMRAQSAAETSRKAADIMDVNPDAVRRVMAEHGVQRLVHGHTHRPAIHDEHGGQRIVVGDWEQSGVYLSVGGGRWSLRRYPEESLVDELAG